MGVSATTYKLAKPTGITKNRFARPRPRPRHSSLKIHCTRSRTRNFYYTDLDGVIRMVRSKKGLPKQVNDYVLDPSWTSQPYPDTFLPGGVWPPRHIRDIICSTSPEYIPCVGPTCYDKKSTPCHSPSCTHTLSAWKTATSDWEKYIELRATPDRGIGTYTKRAFRAGTILGWYAGELKPVDAIHYGTNDYLMDVEIGDIDPNTPAGSTYMGVIDAETTGNWTRFINHSCAADCVFSLKRVGKTRIMVVQAVKDIPSGKELSVDYGSSYYGLQSRKRCGCGARECVEKKRRRLERARRRKQV